MKKLFRRLLTPFLFLGGAIVSLLIYNVYTISSVYDLAMTLFVASAFFFLRILFRGIGKYLHNSKVRYTFQKTASIILLVLALIIVIRIWVEDPQALLVAYGLITAGVAVALQDVFKNIAGGIAILVTGLYRVGNRIEIGGRQGDVIDIGIFYTTLLEMGDWVDGDQSTGRIMSLPNGKVLGRTVHNYTRDHHYLWDEVAIPITYESDIGKAVEILTDVAGQHTDDFSREARRSLTQMERRYYLSERNMEPSVFMKATDNWILLTTRYVVEARERREILSQITEDLIMLFQNAEDVEIASETIDIIDSSNKKA